MIVYIMKLTYIAGSMSCTSPTNIKLVKSCIDTSMNKVTIDPDIGLSPVQRQTYN